ncbi:glutamine-hydrolyzing GMP synthase [Caryophanon tenue]|uniref:glutamine-hydrolyzing GMP synthase n=1 Tax=Caryophanon tenue TaxID=33978 RepID=UPI001B800CDE
MGGCTSLKQDNILVLDLGSSENTTIARWIRDLGVYSEIHPHDITAQQIKDLQTVKGIILNGGKNNIVDGEAIDVLDEIYSLGLPVISVEHPSTKASKTLAQWPNEEEAKAFLKEFVFDTCQAEANWNMKNFIEDQVALLRQQIGDKKVLLALSGGVDSSVVAALLIKAIGKQLVCVHVNHGLMRKNESEGVIQMFEKDLEENLVYVDASERFLGKLKGIAEPEEKRKIIGNEFIRVFEEEARKLDGIDFLAQGTIYPDIVESGTKTHKVVKSHHNVGGLPEDLQFELVEPLFQLFKDEVRACGVELGLPHDMVYRQPFPGPGLGVRVLGEIEPERLEAVRESDAILREEFALAGLDKKVWQYFTVVPNFKSVGVRDNERTYEYPVIIRAVNTIDAMTATIEPIDWPILLKITDRIINEVKHVNRVCYDLSPKPGGTIEWE